MPNFQILFSRTGCINPCVSYTQEKVMYSFLII